MSTKLPFITPTESGPEVNLSGFEIDEFGRFEITDEDLLDDISGAAINFSCGNTACANAACNA